MWFLRSIVLTQLPFLVSVLAFVLLTFGDNLPLLEHNHGRSDALLKIFLIDFGPVSVVSLLANLNALQELLFIDLQCRKILRSKDVRWAVKTRKFGKFTDQLRRFDTVADR